MTPLEASLWGLAAGIIPVFAFLAALLFLDTFQLFRPGRVAAAVSYGAVAGLAAWLLNRWIFSIFGPGADWYARFGTPWVEESLKAAWIVYQIRKDRLGFMVDASICGFAIGAGFALVENLTYLHQLAGAGTALWIVRGFGTAVMHGGATATVGVMAIAFRRQGKARSLALGFAISILVHTIWDAGFLSPLHASLVVVLTLPPIFVITFVRSERALCRWIGRKLDKDIDLLEMLSTGNFLESPAGRYLQSLNSLPPRVLGDMVCVLQITSELSAEAKGNLIRLGAGLPPLNDPELERKLRELDFLHGAIGLAGRHALTPLLSLTSRDRWELRHLAEVNGVSRPWQATEKEC